MQNREKAHTHVVVAAAIMRKDRRMPVIEVRFKLEKETKGALRYDAPANRRWPLILWPGLKHTLVLHSFDVGNQKCVSAHPSKFPDFHLAVSMGSDHH
jgi:hypothetical protein